jgi:hypothetical protein
MLRTACAFSPACTREADSGVLGPAYHTHREDTAAFSPAVSSLVTEVTTTRFPATRRSRGRLACGQTSSASILPACMATWWLGPPSAGQHRLRWDAWCGLRASPRECGARRREKWMRRRMEGWSPRSSSLRWARPELQWAIIMARGNIPMGRGEHGMRNEKAKLGGRWRPWRWVRATAIGGGGAREPAVVRWSLGRSTALLWGKERRMEATAKVGERAEGVGGCGGTRGP